ncbi:hypothetical protein CDAR_387841 [Caerostris darwini]|uniref:Uncharacterized protein n=1 Tax=Caerostris darwini TaxID=1538125 RepID=A0AAV4STH2_9ARAC|nr:hypothetical protein CDAR_387841 [Caerostris darwini]
MKDEFIFLGKKGKRRGVVAPLSIWRGWGWGRVATQIHLGCGGVDSRFNQPGAPAKRSEGEKEGERGSLVHLSSESPSATLFAEGNSITEQFRGDDRRRKRRRVLYLMKP